MTRTKNFLFLWLLLFCFLIKIKAKPLGDEVEPVPWISHDVPSPSEPCPVCLEESNQKVAQFNCIHEMCHNCSLRVKQTRNECPLCRSQPPTPSQLFSAFVAVSQDPTKFDRLHNHLTRYDNDVKEKALRIALENDLSCVALLIVSSIDFSFISEFELLFLLVFLEFSDENERFAALGKLSLGPLDQSTLHSLEVLVFSTSKLCVKPSLHNGVTETLARATVLVKRQAMRLSLIGGSFHVIDPVLGDSDAQRVILSAPQATWDKAYLLAVDRGLCRLIPRLLRGNQAALNQNMFWTRRKPSECIKQIIDTFPHDWILSQGLDQATATMNFPLMNIFLQYILMSQDVSREHVARVKTLFKQEFVGSVQELVTFTHMILGYVGSQSMTRPILQLNRFVRAAATPLRLGLTGVDLATSSGFIELRGHTYQCFRLIAYFDSLGPGSLFSSVANVALPVAAASNDQRHFSAFLPFANSTAKDMALVIAASLGYTQITRLVSHDVSTSSLDIALVSASLCGYDSMVAELLVNASQDGIDVAYLLASIWDHKLVRTKHVLQARVSPHISESPVGFKHCNSDSCRLMRRTFDLDCLSGRYPSLFSRE